MLEAHRINGRDVIDSTSKPNTDLRGIKAVETLSISNRKIYRFRAIRRPGFLFFRASALNWCRPAGVEIRPSIHMISDPIGHGLILLYRDPAPHRCNVHPAPPLETWIPLSEEQVPKGNGQCVMIGFLPMLVKISERIENCHCDNWTIFVSDGVLSEDRRDQTLGSIQFLLDNVVFIGRIDPEIFLCFLQ
jgi:hypothetical protein